MNLPAITPPPAPETPAEPTPTGWSLWQTILIYAAFVTMCVTYVMVSEKMLPAAWGVVPLAIYVAMAFCDQVERLRKRQELREFERLRNRTEGRP